MLCCSSPRSRRALSVISMGVNAERLLSDLSSRATPSNRRFYPTKFQKRFVFTFEFYKRFAKKHCIFDFFYHKNQKLCQTADFTSRILFRIFWGKYVFRLKTCWDVRKMFFVSDPTCPFQVQPLCEQAWWVPSLF